MLYIYGGRNMASRELESIIANLPPATVKGTEKKISSQEEQKNQVAELIEANHIKADFYEHKTQKLTRLVATVAPEVKDEIREKAKLLSVTETVIILTALKSFGIESVKDSMLVDKRTLR